MTTLLLRLQGPMQSWGTTSRFDERDTQLEPSKSGVLGLICAALGRDRKEDIQDLADLRRLVCQSCYGIVGQLGLYSGGLGKFAGLNNLPHDFLAGR